MAQRNLDVRTLVSEWVRGRRGYMAGAVLALVMVVFAVARFAPAADLAVAETAADAEAAAARVSIDSAAAAADAAAVADSVAAAEAAPAESPIVLEGASTEEMFGFSPIENGVPRMKRPDVVRGLYLNAYAAGSDRKLDRLIRIANETEINAFVIDVKEAGHISYDSRIPMANALGVDKPYIRDMRSVLRKLRENNIYPIARIVVFKDGPLSKARPDWAVQHVEGGDWLDSDGYRWVDSYNRNVWDYNIAIAREAIELGFAAVQWDYVRFPDVPGSLMRKGVWPAAEGRSKADGIRDFIVYSQEKLASYDVPITADVFGLTTSAGTDMGIGQLWEKLADVTDALLPMVYPSHYQRGSYGIAHPNASPYETVKTALQHGVRRNSKIENGARIVPWLQDFTLGAPRYDASYVRAQIDAVYDAGLEEWVLWHPGSNYSVEALASADGEVPRLPRPGADSVEVEAKKDGPLGTPIRGH
ncbi:MAG TPA: putative glycoside hydrolase [Longimicrobiales bacterium]|nr:putative glycoside hydrolase [Longimicrobiales bacterium]